MIGIAGDNYCLSQRLTDVFTLVPCCKNIFEMYMDFKHTATDRECNLPILHELTGAGMSIGGALSTSHNFIYMNICNNLCILVHNHEFK